MVNACPLWLIKLLPFLRWWPMVQRDSLRADALAGLTGAVVVLPQGVAFAVIAGMPPEYGLYTAMIPAIIAALFGSSWHLVSGPTTASLSFGPADRCRRRWRSHGPLAIQANGVPGIRCGVPHRQMISRQNS